MDTKKHPHSAYTAPEVVKEMALTLANTALAAGKVFDAEALTTWRAEILIVVEGRLKKRAWELDQSTVLRATQDMGRIAAILAHDSPTIGEVQVLKAFTAVSTGHVVCTAPKGGSTSLGCWCVECP